MLTLTRGCSTPPISSAAKVAPEPGVTATLSTISRRLRYEWNGPQERSGYWGFWRGAGVVTKCRARSTADNALPDRDCDPDHHHTATMLVAVVFVSITLSTEIGSSAPAGTPVNVMV